MLQECGPRLRRPSPGSRPRGWPGRRCRKAASPCFSPRPVMCRNRAHRSEHQPTEVGAIHPRPIVAGADLDLAALVFLEPGDLIPQQRGLAAARKGRRRRINRLRRSKGDVVDHCTSPYFLEPPWSGVAPCHGRGLLGSRWENCQGSPACAMSGGSWIAGRCGAGQPVKAGTRGGRGSTRPPGQRPLDDWIGTAIADDAGLCSSRS